MEIAFVGRGAEEQMLGSVNGTKIKFVVRKGSGRVDGFLARSSHLLALLSADIRIWQSRATLLIARSGA